MSSQVVSGAGPRPVVVGADGCRGGWLTVRTGGEHGDELAADLVDELTAVVDQVRAGRVAVLAVDMPIGLLDDRARACDVAARKVLGARRSTVFPAPVRAVLAATDYRHACRLSRAASGKALSKQAFNLVTAIRELDRLLVPADAETVVEAHPECAFARLDGGPLPSKHTAEGRARRLDLLTAAHGPAMARLVADAADRALPLTDLLDAAALTVTARHVTEGTAIRLGGERDATGKLAQVVY